MYVPKWLITLLVVICLIAGLSAVWVYANPAFWWVVGGLGVVAGIAAIVYLIAFIIFVKVVGPVFVEFINGLFKISGR